VLSAFGTLVSPVRIDLARTLVRELETVDPAERDALLREMCDEGRRVLADAGVPAGEVRFRFGIDARYRGQAHELTIWVGEADAWPVTLEETMRQYSEEYARVYGLSIPDVPVEVVTWRVAAWAPAPVIDLPALSSGKVGVAQSQRPVRFEREREPVDTPIYERSTLGAGARIAGPALIQERETTVVLRPGWNAEVTDDGSVVALREPA
jgi:N-methylhydantoinase A